MKNKALKCPKCGAMNLRHNGHIGGKQRWACRNTSGANRPVCYSTTDPKAPYRDQKGNSKRPETTPIFKRTLGESVQRYVVTCAQNATPANEGFLGALETYCKKRTAELLIIPIRYKNPTSRWTESQANADVWLDGTPWARYLWNHRRKVNDNLMIMGDIKTQPTAVNPLTGFEAITGAKSGIFAHPKLQLKTVATPQGKLPKILTTTGACTEANYVNSRTGKTGEFHHTYAACVVEVRGKIFHMRQLMADKVGGFYDLDQYYSREGVERAAKPLSLTMGDTHVADIDPKVERATFKEIIPALKPRNLVYHDLVSGISHNHHTEKNPFVSLSRAIEGNSNVGKEILDALEFVQNRQYNFVESSVIVPSNHNDWLQFWIAGSDWRTMNPYNREFYLEVALRMVRKAKKIGTQDAERLNAFIEVAREYFADNKKVRVLEYDESCLFGEVEHSLHGHLGPNGQRGNLRNLRRIGVKSNSGHSHQPGIDEGAWAAGTSTSLRLGYNRGPSSWLNAHILTYANSKRTFLNLINGEWRL